MEDMETAHEECVIEPIHASVNVSQLLTEPVGSTRRYEFDELADPEDRGRVQGKVDLIRSNRSVLVHAALSAALKLECARCLKPAKCPITFEINEEFFPTIDATSGLPVKVPEPGGFTIDHNHILDLGEAVRQYALLSVPMKPLCRPDCAGLCPACGKDLNKGRCNCPPETDPRWAALQALKKKLTRPKRRTAVKKKTSERK